MIGKVNNVKLNFAGNTQKPKKENVVSKPQNQNAKQNVVMSKDAAKAMRNMALGILATLGASSMVVSCDDDPDFSFKDESYTEVNVNLHPHPVKPDTIIIEKPIPGDTVRDTITVVLPGDTTYIKPNYQSQVADSLVAHGKNLGFDFEGEGNVPVRIHAFDQWNSTDHDLVFDGKASSEEKMVFIDRAQDFSEDSENPTIKYNRIEYSVDEGRGVAGEISKAPVVGVKPSSAIEWIEVANVCATNNNDGTISLAQYDDNRNLTPVGYLEKEDDEYKDQTGISFYENLFSPSGYEDSYGWSEAKMVLATPEK